MNTRKKEKCIFCWSGGKDSALALYRVSMKDKYEIVTLLTSVNSQFNRVSIHGVPEILLDQQAEAIGLPLIKMYVSEGTNAEYESKMEEILLEYKKQGVSKVIFGDIFLEDLREYREKNLEKAGLTGMFPLWKENTVALAQEFLSNGFKTITCCVNDALMNESDVGKEFNADFINSLPSDVDPCGENGEFHTFCYDGPVFNYPVSFSKGEIIYRSLGRNGSDDDAPEKKTRGFWYCDLLPV